MARKITQNSSKSVKITQTTSTVTVDEAPSQTSLKWQLIESWTFDKIMHAIEAYNLCVAGMKDPNKGGVPLTKSQVSAIYAMKHLGDSISQWIERAKEFGFWGGEENGLDGYNELTLLEYAKLDAGVRKANLIASKINSN